MVSSNTLRSMAAEGMHMPCLAAVMYAYFVNPEGSWWQGEGDSMED